MIIGDDTLFIYSSLDGDGVIFLYLLMVGDDTLFIYLSLDGDGEIYNY